MAKTKVELAKEVLRQLGVLDALATASAEDSAYVEDAYDHKLSELRDMGLAYWPSTGRAVEEIPDAVFGALTDILTEDCAATFGKQLGPATDIYSGRQVSVGTKGMRSLRRHMAKGPSGEPTRATFY